MASQRHERLQLPPPALVLNHLAPWDSKSPPQQPQSCPHAYWDWEGEAACCCSTGTRSSAVCAPQERQGLRASRLQRHRELLGGHGSEPPDKQPQSKG